VNRKTFQKSSAALTPPAMAKSSREVRSLSSSPSMHEPIARDIKCGDAREKGRRQIREKRPSASQCQSGQASDCDVGTGDRGQRAVHG